MFRKKRNVLVNFDDLAELLAILDKHNLTWHNLSVGNCGWAKSPKCWFVYFRASNNEWVSILTAIKRKQINLLPETEGY